MSETPVTIPVGGVSLEALYEKGAGADTAIVLHPHPLYGGSLHNNVVSALQSSFVKRGWGTLRYNMRGVGRSGGAYGGGDPEARDLEVVAEYISQQSAGRAHIAGYSFGAWIALKAVRTGLNPDSLLLVSPPLDFLDFCGLGLPAGPCLVTLGEKDDFCSIRSLRAWLAAQKPEAKNVVVETLPRCDHFYWGMEGALSDIVSNYLNSNPRTKDDG